MMTQRKGSWPGRHLAKVLLASVALAGNSVADQSPRVVSTAGSLTEIMYQLGVQDVLVGVDTTSLWPEEASELPQVGYQRALSAEGILSLAPTLVIATAEAGPAEVLQQIDGAGVQVKTFDHDYSLPALYGRIRQMGEWFDRSAEANELISQMQDDVTATQERTASGKKPKVVLLLGAEAGSSMAAGSDTAAQAMIEYSGGINALGDYSGYKPVNAEALIKAAPEYIIVVSHGDDGEEGLIDAVASLPGVELTPAGINRQFIVADALRFLGFGPRSTRAMLDMSARFYPEAAAQ